MSKRDGRIYTASGNIVDTAAIRRSVAKAERGAKFPRRRMYLQIRALCQLAEELDAERPSGLKKCLKWMRR